jgi:hypothetical protein
METLIDKNISKEGEYGSYTLLAAGATWNDSTSYSRREKDKKQYCGKLVCDENHSCKNIPYALNKGKGYNKIICC